ncbi:TonB-dependent siderophore receptor [Luteimonas sp. RIT-PG2_3]
MSTKSRPLQRSPLALQLSLLLVSMAALPAFGQDAASDTPRTDAKTLDTVSVFGTLDNTISAGGKDGQSLRDTPKSVTVMTSERIEAQNLTDLQEALIQTTGVTVGAYSPVDSFFYSRGFRVQTLQFDGGAPAFTGGLGFFYTPDTAYLERIEMLRGVDGMYSGAGEPGGVINLVRKRPLDYLSTKLDLSLGSWDNRRAQIDVTGPLAMDGRLRGRAVAAYVDKGYFWDRANTRKDIVYGVLEFDATDTTVLSLGANYEKRDESSYVGWAGVPRYADGGDLYLPRSQSFAPDWAHWDFTNKEFFFKAEQKYGETGTIRLNLSRIEQESEAKYLLISGYVDPATGAQPVAYGSHNSYDSSQDLADLSASGKFGLFGRSDHSYTVGVDFAKLDGGGQQSYVSGYAYDPVNNSIDVFNYDPADFPERPSTLGNYIPVNRQIQRGYYATVGLQLTDPLRLTIGGRYGSFNYKQVVNRIGPPASVSYISRSDTAFIPSAALSYKLSDRWTSYLSYGENYKIQASLLKGPLPGTPLDPITGNSLELGIKGELFKGVNAAAAIYRVKRVGEGISDPAYPANVPGAEGSSCCYIGQADITSEGIDLEFSGLIAPGWQLFSGYTYVRTQYNGMSGDAGFYGSGAFLLGVTPRQLLKVWSTYRLPGKWSRLTLNGGVIAQSEGFMSGYVPADPADPDTDYLAFKYSQGGYALWNASVQFEIDDTWTVGLYGDNLTDKRYYQAIGSIYNENVYGTPRSYNLTLKGRW